MQGIMNANADKVTEKRSYNIIGIPVTMFAIISLVVLLGAFTGYLPKGMIGALAVMMIIGVVFNEVGNKTPIINTFLGGGPIVIIFGSAALAFYKIIPETTTKNIADFMTSGGYLDFYIAALITGSILGMSRKLLINAALRYFPVVVCGALTALAFVGIMGAILGYGAKEAILFIGVPMMGGGMGAGVVPLSKMFGEVLNVDPSQMLSVMIPASTLGNAMCIVAGGLLNRLGKVKTNWTGNGKLMIKNQDIDTEEKEENRTDFRMMGIGLLLAMSFAILGTIIGKLVPAIHGYAWMIITVAVIKALGIIPRKFELAATQWSSFVMTNLTSGLLVGIGIAYTDFRAVAAALTLKYILLVIMVILGVTLGAGLGGKLVGFYPIESSITAGLCMSNMGGTGDVAVLSAANRMELMPFAQISTRIGGAFMLILASALAKILM